MTRFTGRKIRSIDESQINLPKIKEFPHARYRTQLRLKNVAGNLEGGTTVSSGRDEKVD